MFDLISVKYSEDVGMFSVIKRKWLGIVNEDDECIEVEKLWELYKVVGTFYYRFSKWQLGWEMVGCWF